MKKNISLILLAITMIVSCCVFSSCGDKQCNHAYDNNCDTICNQCGEVRNTNHIYDNNCDTTCNICKAERTITHIYDNDCDSVCNICGGLREVSEHIYDNHCDPTCNICNSTRIPEQHIYDNNQDNDCNICGYVREIEIHEHSYDNDCDVDCNKCGEQRSVLGHVYDNGCDDTCNVCSATRTVEGHQYDNSCDEDCNVCGTKRIIEHAYDNQCDSTCNVCSEERKTTHVFNEKDICNICNTLNSEHIHMYDNNCDEVCNICEYLRTAPHVFIYSCSNTCSDCETVRYAIHIDNDNNKQCDFCEMSMLNNETETETKISSFISYFNNYLNSVHDRTREDLLSSNTMFDNLMVSGSINLNNEISSIVVYDNFKHYTYKDGSEIFVVQTENGNYLVSHYNGHYEFAGTDMFNNHSHEHLFPLVSREDVSVNENGTISISGEYIKKLYKAWFNSDVPYSWFFGTYQFSYYELNYWMDYADFVTEIECDVNGKITSYRIVLKDNEKEYYNATFTTSTANTKINIVMDTGISTNISFVYNHGVNGNAEFNIEVVDFYGTHTLSLKTDVTTNVPDFVSNQELDNALADANNTFNNIVAMANKYNHEYTMDSICEVVACYDNTYNMYAVFEYYNGKYYYIGCTITLDGLNACSVTVNENNTLVIIEHHFSESINETLETKYSGKYQILNASDDIEVVFIYDKEFNVYTIFVKMRDAFEYGGFINEIPSEYVGLIPIGTIDIVNKTISI